ncbi:hypothetical protein [Micromonospora sp. CPCC 205714]|uniref:hypothetical protein n=1 Tax=Micromonospora sp. CPCC 205714 TaxID=3122402 RepID=UPI002FF22D64
MAALRRSGSPYTLAPKALAASLMLTSGGMTGRLDRLERAGLVRRPPVGGWWRSRPRPGSRCSAGSSTRCRPPTGTGWPICCARCSPRPRPGPRIRHNDRHRHRPEGRPCLPPNRRSSRPAWVSPAVAVAPGTHGPAPCST